MKPFQDELQEAISDYATNKKRDEYSDDFESDEDGVLNGKTKSNLFLCVLPFLKSLLDPRESLCVKMILCSKISYFNNF